MAASTMTASAMPIPSCLMVRTSPAANPAKTTTISKAAEVMIRPVSLETERDREIVVAGAVMDLP